MQTIHGSPSRIIGRDTARRPYPGLRISRPSSYKAISLLLAASAVVSMPSEPSADPPVQPVYLDIISFAGDTIHALMRTETAGPGRPVRLHPRDLVGHTWTAQECHGGRCQTVTQRITAVVSDTGTNTMPQQGDNSDIWLYRVEYALPAAPGEWHNACAGNSPDMGIFVNGRWSADGTWHPGGWTFSCPSGVIAKCVRGWGYKPWKTLHSPVCGDVDLQPLHQACTRAARADYCGDGTSYTREHTLIDMFDTCGLNVREHAPERREESAFDEHGALWVSTPRWPTATATDSGWRFDGCEQPRHAPERAASALIHVWSDPSKGRAELRQ